MLSLLRRAANHRLSQRQSQPEWPVPMGRRRPISHRLWEGSQLKLSRPPKLLHSSQTRGKRRGPEVAKARILTEAGKVSTPIEAGKAEAAEQPMTTIGDRLPPPLKKTLRRTIFTRSQADGVEGAVGGKRNRKMMRTGRCGCLQKRERALRRKERAKAASKMRRRLHLHLLWRSPLHLVAGGVAEVRRRRRKRPGKRSLHHVPRAKAKTKAKQPIVTLSRAVAKLAKLAKLEARRARPLMMNGTRSPRGRQ